MDSVSSVAKRRSSSEYCVRRSNAEKHRRIRLADRIACLKKALPIGLLSAKATKVDVLDCACRFVNEMLNRLNEQSASPEGAIPCEEHEKEISRLQAYCKQLEKRCAHYASIVDSSESLRFLDLNLGVDPSLSNENQTTGDRLKGNASSEKSCIVIYSPRIGGGKRKRATSPFKSALKCRQILPRPVGENCGERSDSNGQNAENGVGLMANTCPNANYFTLVHINADGHMSDPAPAVPIEAPLLNDGNQALRVSSAVQTEDVLNGVLSMPNGSSICVDSATSPIVSNELNSLMETYLSSKRMEESVSVNGGSVSSSINPVDSLGSSNERTPKKDRHSVASLLQLSDLIDEQMEPVEDLFFNDKTTSNAGFEESELICHPLSGPVEQASLYPSYVITPKDVSPSSGTGEITQVNPVQCGSNVNDVGGFPVSMHAYDGQISLNDSMQSFPSRPAGHTGSVFPSIDSLISDQPSVPASYERQSIPGYKHASSRQPANFSVEYLQQTSASSQEGAMAYDSFFGIPGERMDFPPCSEFRTPISNVHWSGNGTSIDFWPRLFRGDCTSGQQYTQFSDGQAAVGGDGRDLNLSKPVFDQPSERQVYPNAEIIGAVRPVGRVHQFQIESMIPEVFGNGSTHQPQAAPLSSGNATGNTVSFPWLNLGPAMIPPNGVQPAFGMDSSGCGLLPSQHSCSSSGSLENTTLHCSLAFNSESQMTGGDGLLGNSLGLDTANCFL